MFPTFLNNKTNSPFWLALAVGIGAMICFLLGFIAGSVQNPPPITYGTIAPEALKIGDNLASNTPENGQKLPQEGYVASVNGKNYYPKDCSAAQRLNQENIISFISVQEAEEAGYKRSNSCP